MQISTLLLTVLCLAAVLGLILLAGRLARRMGLPGRLGNQPAGRLAPVQAVALDARRRVHLLRCDDRHFLLLTGGTEDLFLGWIAEPERDA
jgi:flagellar protein FliO/FliZ